MSKEATALEAACDVFLASYSDALPRIARRGLEPVLEALAALLRAAADGQRMVSIFRYGISAKGERVPEGAEAHTFGNVVYDIESHEMTWRVSRVFETPEGVVEAALPSFRVVTMEDVVELGIQPREIVEFVRAIARNVGYHEVVQSATQPLAKA